MNKLSKILLFVFAPLFVLSFVFGGVAVASGSKEEPVEAKTSIAQKLTEIEDEEFYVVSNGEVYSNSNKLTSTDNRLSFKNNKLIMVFTKGSNQASIIATSLIANTEQVVAVISATKAEDGITISTVDAVNDGTIKHSLDAEYTLGKMVTNTEEEIKYSNGEFEILSSSNVVALTAATDATTALVANLAGGEMEFYNQTYGKEDSTTTGRAFYVTGGTLTLENTKIKKFNTRTLANPNGGAVYVAGGIFNLDSQTLISGCSATYGGGVYIASGSININGKIFDSVATANGGAVYMAGSSVCNVTSVSFIEGNSATDYGGAIYVAGGTLTQTGGDICSNSAEYGGAIACNEAVATINLQSGYIEENSAHYGAAIYVHYTQPDAPTVTQYLNLNIATVSRPNKMEIYNNTTTETDENGYYGGAIYMNGRATRVTIGSSNTNPYFSENTANRGGVIYTTNKAILTINSGEFDGNRAQSKGGVLYNKSPNTTINGGDYCNNSADKEGSVIKAEEGLVINDCNMESDNHGTDGAVDVDCYGSTLSTTTINGGSINDIRGRSGTIDVYDGDFYDFRTYGVSHNVYANIYGGSFSNYLELSYDSIINIEDGSFNCHTWSYSNAQVTISGGDFDYQWKEFTAGSSSAVTITGGSFYDMKLKGGSATVSDIYVRYLYLSNDLATSTIIDCEIENKISISAWDSDTDITIRDCDFSSMSVEITSAAECYVYFQNCDFDESFVDINFGNYVYFTDCTFENNVSRGYEAGAIYFAGGNWVECYLTRCSFTDLTNNYGSFGGGAIHARDCYLSIDDCSFTNCQADGQRSGGAILARYNCDISIKDTTFTNCSAYKGGAIAMRDSEDINVYLNQNVSFTNCSATYGRDIYMYGYINVYNTLNQDIYVYKNPVASYGDEDDINCQVAYSYNSTYLSSAASHIKLENVLNFYQYLTTGSDLPNYLYIDGHLSVNVTFNPNGGSVSPTSKSYETKKPYGTLPTPTKSGAGFLGWSPTNSANDIITTSTIVTNQSDHTLYAIWGANVTLDGQGGTMFNYAVEKYPSSGNYGFSLNSNGYFESTNKGVGSTYAMAKVTFTLTQSATITIYYISSGHLGSNYGVISKLDTALSQSYSNSDSGNYTLRLTYSHSTSQRSCTINASAGTHSIYFKYCKGSSTNSGNDSLQFKISIPANATNVPSGGTTASIVVPYNSTYGAMPTPAIAGCNFLGYYTAPTGGTLVNSSSTIVSNSNHTLYAHYEDDRFDYTITDSTNHYCSIKPKNKAFMVGDVVLPSTATIDGVTYTVTSIDAGTSYSNGVFCNCSSMTAITIPNTITSIGAYAFYGCSNLEIVTIGTGVQSIGKYAFNSCYKLNTINYNATACNDLVQSNYTFPYGDLKKNHVTLNIGSNVTRIPANIFYPAPYTDGAAKIDTINWIGTSSCTTIGTNAFYYNTRLYQFTIPASVTSIDSQAFYNCSNLCEVYNLSNLNVVKGSTTNGYVAYYAKVVHTSASEESQIVEINGLKYYKNTSTQYTLVGRVDSSIKELTSSNIDSRTTAISSSAFEFTDITRVVIPNYITSIGTKAFYGCNKLTSLTIGSGVTTLTDSCFSQTGLTSVTIPGTVRTLNGFANCNSLSSVTIENGVTTISSSAFVNSPLTSVFIPASVRSIGNDAFGVGSGTTRLTSITVDSANQYFASENDGLYNKDKTKLIFYALAKTSAQISSSTIEIGAKAFSYWQGTSITIPSSVTTIGSQAFFACRKLTSITIPSSVTKIGNYCFSVCNNLTSITFENTSNWYRTGNSSYSGGTLTDVSDPAQNATWLKNTSGYYNNYWYTTATVADSGNQANIELPVDTNTLSTTSLTVADFTIQSTNIEYAKEPVVEIWLDDKHKIFVTDKNDLDVDFDGVHIGE